MSVQLGMIENVKAPHLLITGRGLADWIGVDMTKGTGARARTAARDAEILRMCIEGYPHKEIAAKYGVDLSRITFVARRGGLPPRTTQITPGAHVSEEARRNMSEAALKRPPRDETYRANIAKAKRGAKNGQWIGDAVGYAATHDWLRKNYGTPEHCEHCGGINAKSDVYNWAYLGVGGEYNRRREDYMRLCRSCHTRCDRYGMEVQRNYPLPT